MCVCDGCSLKHKYLVPRDDDGPIFQRGEMSHNGEEGTTAVVGDNSLSHGGIAGETFTEKFKRKFKAQPLVPIGTYSIPRFVFTHENETFVFFLSVNTGFVATAGILTAGLANFRKGGPASVSHRMMKLRVMAQAFTVGAFILGGGSLLNKSIEAPSDTTAMSTNQEDSK